ncbi:MAG: glycosyltransferase [Myxococcales bacterium]|nr:glycosyltransferase [Myxococcales bacterium]
MNIAILGPVHPYRGGIAHYTTSLMQALERAGHQCRVINFTRQYPDLLFPGKTQEDTTESAFEVDSQRLIDSANPVSWVKTSRMLGRERPDVVLVQWWHPYFAFSYGTIGHLVRRFSGSKIIFLCHNVLPHESSFVDRVLTRYAFGGASGFIVQASEQAKLLASLVGEGRPVEVAPHPVYDVFAKGEVKLEQEAARRQLGTKAPNVLLFFGYIRPYKGLRILLHALAKLQTEDVELIVAGECYEKVQEYRDLINELGLSDRVQLFDRYVENDEVPGLFAAADVVVLPYLSATQSGIVQVAYAFGKPVIVSRVGGIPEVVDEGHSGLLVEPDDPQGLATAIDRFYEENLAETLSAGVIEKREEFGWDKVVSAVELVSA